MGEKFKPEYRLNFERMINTKDGGYIQGLSKPRDLLVDTGGCLVETFQHSLTKRYPMRRVGGFWPLWKYEAERPPEKIVVTVTRVHTGAGGRRDYVREPIPEDAGKPCYTLL